ncbi:MAG: hypothetical protein EAX90_05950 [Candidatus Heimdallarchaeota archaeon]|nr:hypothetical protein [Candidatus Heimdallarchaeota archaeon]
MPLDKDTLDFLVNETIDNALEDTKMKLNELAIKYKLEINVRPPIIIEIKQVDNGKVIWEK